MILKIKHIVTGFEPTTTQFVSKHATIWPKFSFLNSVVAGSHPVAVTSDITPVSSKRFLEIQAIIGCRFTRKPVCDMMLT